MGLDSLVKESYLMYSCRRNGRTVMAATSLSFTDGGFAVISGCMGAALLRAGFQPSCLPTASILQVIRMILSY